MTAGLLVAATACASVDPTSSEQEPAPLTTAAGTPDVSEVETSEAGGCADVVAVDVDHESGNSYRFAVTVQSDDTGWEQYADLWQVAAEDGTVLGERVLAHPHVDEQPFTRSLSAVALPRDVAVVTIRARDSVAGFCGAALDIEIARP